MEIRSRKILIHEIEANSWRVTDTFYATTRTYKTAMCALKAVKRFDKKELERRNVSSVTHINWYPTTEVGRLTVLVITD